MPKINHACVACADAWDKPAPQPIQCGSGKVHRIKRALPQPGTFELLCGNTTWGLRLGLIPNYPISSCPRCDARLSPQTERKPFKPHTLSVEAVSRMSKTQLRKVVICELHFADGHVDPRIVDRDHWRAARWFRKIPGVSRVDLVAWRSKAVLGSVTE